MNLKQSYGRWRLLAPISPSPLPLSLSFHAPRRMNAVFQLASHCKTALDDQCAAQPRRPLSGFDRSTSALTTLTLSVNLAAISRLGRDAFSRSRPRAPARGMILGLE